jgi:hypothetical protein
MTFRFTILVSSMISTTLLGRPASAQHFFPNRPHDVTTLSDVGVLIDYGIGNGTGEFAIKDAAGRTTDFFIAYPIRINGRTYNCYRPPKPGKRFDRSYCKQWPNNVVIGSTKVRITYWWMVPPGSSERVRVSDAIRSFSGS